MPLRAPTPGTRGAAIIAGRVRATGATAAAPVRAPPPAITLTEAALTHLKRLRDDSGSDRLLLRMGVKSGGCSGIASRTQGVTSPPLSPLRRASQSALLTGSGQALKGRRGGLKLSVSPPWLAVPRRAWLTLELLWRG